jgi:hypothetical protein
MNIYTQPVSELQDLVEKPAELEWSAPDRRGLQCIPSLFQAKKAAMLKKLRTKGLGATHTITLCNADAVHERYGLAADVSEYHLLVDVTTGAGRLLSNRAGTLVPVNAGSTSTTP